MRGQRGYGLIAVLIALLIMGLMYARNLQIVNPQGEGPNPIEKSWDAVCKVNKAAIQTAIPMYNMTHEPMKELDIQKLSSQISIPPPPKGCPCSYTLNVNGVVSCKAHN